MARIAVGGFHHETNCFVPVQTDFDYFATVGDRPPLSRGEEVLHNPALNKDAAFTLAERIDITLANLSILKTGKARAIRFSTLDAICELFPTVRRMRMLRNWGGIVDVCPDASPIISKTPVPNMFFNCGWGTGGFKATPGAGHLLAWTMAKDEPHPVNAPFTLERFRDGVLIDEAWIFGKQANAENMIREATGGVTLNDVVLAAIAAKNARMAWAMLAKGDLKLRLLGTKLRGDWKETMSTHWFHDHMLDYTAQNVYKGNAAMMNYYSSVDRGNEALNDGVNLRFPSGSSLDWGNRDYDVNLVIADKALALDPVDPIALRDRNLQSRLRLAHIDLAAAQDAAAHHLRGDRRQL